LGGDRQRQFQVFGAAIDKKMQNAWVAPMVRSVNTLEKYEALIPPIIRQHYEDIVARGTGYQGYCQVVSNIGDARWVWEVDVLCLIGGNDVDRLPIRYRGGFFEDELMEIGEPCLWIFDCRRGATEGDDVLWAALEYGKVLQQLRRWMAGIHQWNAIFLLPMGVFFEKSMQKTFAMSTRSTWLRGVWIFQLETVPAYMQDLRYGGQVEQAVQAIGGVAIIMEHPAGSRAAQNVRNGREKSLVAFTNMWNEDRKPSAVDRLERSSTELQRLVQAYLLDKWGLLAFGITTSIVDIVEQGFKVAKSL
jgi:hypothetical protein